MYRADGSHLSKMEGERYLVFQLMDLCTFNFAHIGGKPDMPFDDLELVRAL